MRIFTKYLILVLTLFIFIFPKICFTACGCSGYTSAASEDWYTAICYPFCNYTGTLSVNLSSISPGLTLSIWLWDNTISAYVDYSYSSTLYTTVYDNHSYTVEIWTESGTGSFSYSVTYPNDTILPVLSVSSPYPTDKLQGNVTVSFNYSDNQSCDSGIIPSSREIYVDGVLKCNNCSSYNWDTTGYSDGTHNHTYKCKVKDYADNSQENTYSVTIDNDPPVVTINNPYTYYHNDDIYISFTASDPSGLDVSIPYAIYIDSIFKTANNSYNWTNPTEGPHTVQCYSWSVLNNQTLSNYYVFVDKTDPVVNIQSPTNGACVQNNVSINVDFSDPGGGNASGIDLTTREIEVDYNLLCNNCSSVSWDTTDYVDGAHNIYGNVYDKADNYEFDYISVVVDNLPAVPNTPTVSSPGISRALDVSWTWNGDFTHYPTLNHFEVHRSITNGFTPSANTLIDTVSKSGFGLAYKYRDNSVENFTTYYYKIIAVESDIQNSTLNNTKSISAQGFGQSTINPPSNVQAVDTGAGHTVKLTWDWDDSDPDTGSPDKTRFGSFKIYRKKSTDPSYEYLTSINNNTEIYLDDGDDDPLGKPLVNKQTYLYQVTAYDALSSAGKDESTPETSGSITPTINTVSSLTYEDMEIGHTIKLQWHWNDKLNENDNSKIVYFDIYRDSEYLDYVMVYDNKNGTTYDYEYIDEEVENVTSHTYDIIVIDDTIINPPTIPTGSDESSPVTVNNATASIKTPEWVDVYDPTAMSPDLFDGDTLKISWEWWNGAEPSPNNLTGFKVWRSTSSSFSTYVETNLPINSSFLEKSYIGSSTIYSIQNSGSVLWDSEYYYYKVFAYDDSSGYGFSNDTSDPSEYDSENPLIGKPARLAISNVGDGRKLDLSWTTNPQVDVNAYAVYASRYPNVSKAFYELIFYADHSPPSPIEFTADYLMENVTYYFRIAGLENSGREGPLSDMAQGTTENTAPPAQPLEFYASPGDKVVNLSWDDNDEWDLQGYKIYRNGALLTTLNRYYNYYIDNNVVNGNSYSYYLKAYDTGGMESASSITNTVIPRDTIPPAQVLNLIGSGYDNRVELKWQGNEDDDISKYYIYRDSYSGFTPNINNKVGETNHPVDSIGQPFKDIMMVFNDTTVINAVDYYYKVCAVDTSMNIGESSDEVLCLPKAGDITIYAINGITDYNSSDYINLECGQEQNYSTNKDYMVVSYYASTNREIREVYFSVYKLGNNNQVVETVHESISTVPPEAFINPIDSNNLPGIVWNYKYNVGPKAGQYADAGERYKIKLVAIASPGVTIEYNNLAICGPEINIVTYQTNIVGGTEARFEAEIDPRASTKTVSDIEWKVEGISSAEYTGTTTIENGRSVFKITPDVSTGGKDIKIIASIPEWEITEKEKQVQIDGNYNITVIADSINVRYGPSSVYEAFNYLSKDTVVTAIADNGKTGNQSWYQIQIDPMTTGWITGNTAYVSYCGNLWERLPTGTWEDINVQMDVFETGYPANRIARNDDNTDESAQNNLLVWHGNDNQISFTIAKYPDNHMNIMYEITSENDLNPSLPLTDVLKTDQQTYTFNVPDDNDNRDFLIQYGVDLNDSGELDTIETAGEYEVFGVTTEDYVESRNNYNDFYLRDLRKLADAIQHRFANGFWDYPEFEPSSFISTTLNAKRLTHRFGVSSFQIKSPRIDANGHKFPEADMTIQIYCYTNLSEASKLILESPELKDGINDFLIDRDMLPYTVVANAYNQAEGGSVRTVALSLDNALFQFGARGTIGLGGVGVNSSQPYSSNGAITVQIEKSGNNYIIHKNMGINIRLEDVFDFNYFNPDSQFDATPSAAMIQCGFNKTGSHPNAGQVGLIQIDVNGAVTLDENIIKIP